MAHTKDSFYVDAPPDVVWEIGADPNRLQEWNTTVVGVKDVTGPIGEVGSSYTVMSKIAGRPVDVTWTVDRAERGRFAESSATTPLGGSAKQRVQFTPEGSGTRVNIDLDYDIAPGLLGQMISKVFAERSIERDVRHSGENFKALVEEERAAVATR